MTRRKSLKTLLALKMRFREGYCSTADVPKDNTTRAHLKDLVKMGWISIVGDKIYLRSFRRLVAQNGWSRRSVRWYGDADVELRDFITAAICGYIVLSHRRVRKKPGANPNLGGVSCSLLAEYMNVSRTRAWELRSMAAKAGLIVLEKRVQKLDYTPWEVVRCGEPGVFMGKRGSYRRLADKVFSSVEYNKIWP